MLKPGNKNISASMSIGFSVLMFSFWAMMNIGAFHSTYLNDLGLNGVEVGVMMAVNYFMGMVSPPIFANMADRMKNIKGFFQIATVCVGLLSLTLALIKNVRIGSLPLPVLVYPLLFVAYSTAYSLLDSWAIKVSNQTGQMTFSQVRLFGSLGYSLVAIGASYLAGIFGLAMPYIIGFAISLFVLAWSQGRQQPEHEQAAEQGKKGSFKQIFADRRMAMFMVFAFIFSMCMITPLTFMPWVMEHIGADKAWVGSIGGSKALFEAFIMVIAIRYVRRGKLSMLLILSGVFYVIDQLGYIVATQLWHVFAIQIVEGVAYGLFLSAATQYIYNITPSELTASAQSMLVTFSFAGYIAINLVGGWVTETFGVMTLFAINAAMLAVGTLVFVVSLRQNEAGQPGA